VSDRDAQDLHTGVGLGAILGLLWVVEIGVNNVFPACQAPVGTRDAIDDAIWALIGLLTLGVAGLASHRRGGSAPGAKIGLWSGIVSGLFAYLAGLLVVDLFLGAVVADPELVANFPASQFPDLATYATFAIVGASPLVGAAGHLWLLGIAAGTLLGAVGGLAGTLTTKVLGRKTA
jgi:hypothetical protein